MLVTPAHEDYVLAFESQISRIHVCREQLGERSQMRSNVHVGPAATHNPSAQSSDILRMPSSTGPPDMIRVLRRKTVEIPRLAILLGGAGVGKL
jgi:hypothetical protein